MRTLPACCYTEPGASPAEKAYAAYNAAGDPATAGLNFAGAPCPEWSALPDNVRLKWIAAAKDTFNAGLDEASDAVQECREEGETDHRSIMYRIGNRAI